MNILRAGLYAYTPYKFVSFKVNGIECQLPEPLEIKEDLGDMKESREVIECLMKKS